MKNMIKPNMFLPEVYVFFAMHVWGAKGGEKTSEHAKQHEQKTTNRAFVRIVLKQRRDRLHLKERAKL